MFAPCLWAKYTTTRQATAVDCLQSTSTTLLYFVPLVEIVAAKERNVRWLIVISMS